ncbi:MAG: carbon starvation protein A [Candidatus Omnitrophica bacterium]|nr:carbon starvation protein A [Candidatus Omnitrophota bacterium]
MNASILITVVGIIYIFAYRFYGSKIAAIWQIDVNRPTPAQTHYDGIDYVPSKNWMVLFGHHFSSIAGAGPIIGPIMAVCLWGWVPALIWIVVGSIFLGGIHDFGSLIISIRENGATIGDVTAKAISEKAKIIFSVFIWLALILVIAVFAYLGAKTFVSQPAIVIPSLGIIPIAIIVGLGLYRFKWPPTIVTITGLLCLGVLILIGKKYPVMIGDNGQFIWTVVLLIYCFFASTMPVNLLLQPRDYLSSFLLAGGIILAVFGIFVSQPTMNGSAFIANKSSIGTLWPMMFITIACGANSGFHSLISSGTTSKQIANERHAQRIGFGGMLLEGFLAVIVIILVIGGISNVELQQLIADKKSPVSMYGLGFGNITSPFLGQWGTFIALTILNIFILTTLDSATRITRYITEELFHFKNRFVTTFFVLILGGCLALGKGTANNPLWQKIWPAFGASNQLVAGMALLVISCWLLIKKKPTLYSLLPAIFMLLTSLVALVFQIIGYYRNKDFLLIAISVALIASALYLTKEVAVNFLRILRTT